MLRTIEHKETHAKGSIEISVLRKAKNFKGQLTWNDTEYIIKKGSYDIGTLGIVDLGCLKDLIEEVIHNG